MTQPHKDALQIVLPAFLHHPALNVDVIDENLFLPHESREVEAQRSDIGGQFLFRLLERHQHARLAELRRPADEKFRRKERLAAARAAADERGPAPWQAAARDFVEPLDARGGFGQPNGAGGSGNFAMGVFHSRGSLG